MVYKAINSREPFKADFRLRDQTTESAISVINNISEGWASQSNLEFVRFLVYSRRSCAEVQNCFYIALDQEYVNEDVQQEIYEQSKKTIMMKS